MNFRFSLIHLGQTLFYNLLVAGAYFIFGLLGLGLAVPPGMTSSIWPPAGIALASVLLLGGRIAPGIFFGNVGIGLWTLGFNAQTTFISLITATGAVLSALTGSYFIKRFVGFPNALLEDRQIFLFQLLGGPVSSLISATIGIFALATGDQLDNRQIPVNWFNWWLGDSIGVMVFAPLLMTLFAMPKAIWRQRFIPVSVPLILSFLLMTVFFSYFQKVERQQRAQDFGNHSLLLAEALKHRVQDHALSLLAIKSILTGIPDINRADLAAFIHPLLEDFNELQSVKWQLYQNGSTHGSSLKTVFVTDKNPSGGLPPLTERQIERLARPAPLQQNYKFRLKITDERLIFIVPVYRNSASQQKRLIGVISSVVSMPQLIREAYGTLNSEGIWLTIIGSNFDSDYGIIYSNVPGHLPNDSRQHALAIDGQRWRLYFYRDPITPQARTHWFLWWFLISGFIFTSLLGLGLLLLTGRYFRTEQIVNTRTADLLRAKSAAETANKTKDQFLAKISHELRTPLNGIMGFTQLLQNNNKLSGQEKQQLDIISHCGEDLLTLINDILDIAAIENNKIKITVVKFDFLALVNDITELFRLRAKEKHLEFIAKTEHLPHYLNGDKKRIRQILSNLLSNAVKFTDSGRIELTVQYRNEHIEMTVADTGCGISGDNLNRIFLPFLQITGQESAKEGIGIGLAICKELTKLMKGDISVRSQPGLGSEFTVKLPIAGTATQTVSPDLANDAGESQSAVTVNVLIADDNEINLLLLSNLLNKLNCSIDTALNGKEAFRMINHKHYHLAFVDLCMPAMDGIELAKRLRKQGNPLKLIAVSAYADQHMMQDALDAGFDDYLTKPVEPQRLLYLVQSFSSR